MVRVNIDNIDNIAMPGRGVARPYLMVGHTNLSDVTQTT